jgi:hypothetical protein
VVTTTVKMKAKGRNNENWAGVSGIGGGRSGVGCGSGDLLVVSPLNHSEWCASDPSLCLVSPPSPTCQWVDSSTKSEVVLTWSEALDTSRLPPELATEWSKNNTNYHSRPRFAIEVASGPLLMGAAAAKIKTTTPTTAPVVNTSVTDPAVSSSSPSLAMAGVAEVTSPLDTFEEIATTNMNFSYAPSSSASSSASSSPSSHQLQHQHHQQHQHQHQHPRHRSLHSGPLQPGLSNITIMPPRCEKIIKKALPILSRLVCFLSLLSLQPPHYIYLPFSF